MKNIEEVAVKPLISQLVFKIIEYVRRRNFPYVGDGVFYADGCAELLQFTDQVKDWSWK
jgi:hypothetical protein